MCTILLVLYWGNLGREYTHTYTEAFFNENFFCEVMGLNRLTEVCLDIIVKKCEKWKRKESGLKVILNFFFSVLLIKFFFLSF